MAPGDTASKESKVETAGDTVNIATTAEGMRNSDTIDTVEESAAGDKKIFTEADLLPEPKWISLRRVELILTGFKLKPANSDNCEKEKTNEKKYLVDEFAANNGALSHQDGVFITLSRYGDLC